MSQACEGAEPMTSLELQAQREAREQRDALCDAELNIERLRAQCGGAVDRVRWCYATPVCFACLPPPLPIETFTL